MGLLSLFGYNIPAAALGVTFGPTLSRPEETQMIGAYGIFFIFLLWLARHHIKDVVRHAVFLRRGDDSGTEWFSTTVSFWGFVIGSLCIMVWCNHYGMPFMASFRGKRSKRHSFTDSARARWQNSAQPTPLR